MLPYSKHRSCPKCGEIGASSKYRPPLPKAAVLDDTSLLGKTLEHAVIERKCCNCDYSWEENPLDAS